MKSSRIGAELPPPGRDRWLRWPARQPPVLAQHGRTSRGQRRRL